MARNIMKFDPNNVLDDNQNKKFDPNNIINETSSTNKTSLLHKLGTLAKIIGEASIPGAGFSLTQKNIKNLSPETKGGLITGTEIAAPIAIGSATTPIGGVIASPLITGLGEFLRSKAVDKKNNIESLKSGLIGAGTDVATIGAFSALKPAAKFIAKSKALEGIGENASEIINKNFNKYTEPIKDKFSDISEFAGENLLNLRKKLGSLVSESKNKAIEKNIKTDSVSIIDNIKNILKENQISPVNEDTIEKGLKKRPILNKVLNQANQIKDNETPKRLLDIVDNIDDELELTYQTLDKGGKITKAEETALAIRKTINDNAIKKLEESLPQTKKTYANFMNILNSKNGEIKRALDQYKSGNQDNLQKLIFKSIQEGNKTTLDNLYKIDEMLPENKKFFNKILNKSVRENLSKSKELYPSKPGLIDQLLIAIPRAAAYTLRKSEKIPGKTLGQSLKVLGNIPLAEYILGGQNQ